MSAAPPSLASRYRTHSCGELRREHAGGEVRLAGWLMRRRDHGGVLFLDLRDHYGVTQVVIHAPTERDHHLRPESVVEVTGRVELRAPDTINPKLPTGEVEVNVTGITVLSASEVLPFLVAEDDQAPETIRLRHRFLELRRDRLHRNIVLRSQVIQAIREIMHRLGFTEFQTPILTSSSPEGARDFLVPSRLHPGKFYALPQAPQQFKQLLMVAGFDRYFQIAPCFRDEDSRADRSPGEFYQLDLEMSFVEQEHVFAVVERVMGEIFGRFSTSAATAAPFPHISHAEAMLRYGTDKPDLRNPLQIAEVTDLFSATEFKVFRGVLDGGGKIRAIALPVDASPPRSWFDETIAAFKAETGLGLAWLVHEEGEFRSSIAKFFAPAEFAALRERLALTGRTVILFAGGPEATIQPGLGRLRSRLGTEFGLVEPEAFRFCWITDFPMYELVSETGKIDFAHNPFSMPAGGVSALRSADPLTIRACQYDLVCNGYELASGAIRNHDPETMYEAFRIAGYSRAEVDHRFGGMIRAFQFGAPPHGGIAPGIDRIVMLLAGEEAIRDVIAFPLAQNGEDLLMGAPSAVSEKQLREAHIKLRNPPR